MKSLIIYTSKYGSTEKIAHYMKEKLECDSVNLLRETVPDLTSYDRFIVGGSIYYGSIHSKITDLLENNMSLFLSKKLSLFLVCLLSEESAAEQFNLNFNEVLLNHSDIDGFFGGILETKQLNPFEKVVTTLTFKHVNINEALYFDEVDKYIDALLKDADDNRDSL